MKSLIIYAHDCTNDFSDEGVIATEPGSIKRLGFGFVVYPLTDDVTEVGIPQLVATLLPKFIDHKDAMWGGECWLLPDRTPLTDELLLKMVVDYAIEIKKPFWWVSSEVLFTSEIEALCEQSEPPCTLVNDMADKRGLLWRDDNP